MAAQKKNEPKLTPEQERMEHLENLILGNQSDIDDLKSQLQSADELLSHLQRQL